MPMHSKPPPRPTAREDGERPFAGRGASSCRDVKHPSTRPQAYAGDRRRAREAASRRTRRPVWKREPRPHRLAAWAAELGPARGVRVAGVAPGYASTETTMHAVAPAMLDAIVKRTPLKRLATPEEIVAAVRFVMASDFFNGRVLAVDGGLRV